MSDYLEQEAILDTAISTSSDARALEIHTMLPATVTSINHSKQQVTLQLGVKRIYRSGQQVVVPPVAEVPLGVLRGGDFVITLPVAIGDQGAAFFSEREITQWMLAGHEGPVTPRRFDMHCYTDAYFLPALASSARAISNYSSTSLEIRTLDGMTKQSFNAMSIVSKVGSVTMTLDSSGLHISGGIIKSDIDVIAGAGNISLSTHLHISGNPGDVTSPPVPG